jgi:hypothetical protein
MASDEQDKVILTAGEQISVGRSPTKFHLGRAKVAERTLCVSERRLQTGGDGSPRA